MALIAELREKQQKLVADARVVLDEIKDDTPETEAKEKEARYDAIMAEHDQIEAKIKEHEAREARRLRLEEIEEGLSRPDPRRPVGEGRATPPQSHDIAEKRREAFRNYLRYGFSALPSEQRSLLVRDAETEQRALGTMLGTAGGYLVPDGFMPELVKTMKAWGPMLDPGVTRMMMTATGNDIPWPTVDDTSNTGALIGQNTAVSEQDVTVGLVTIGAYKYTSKLVLVASELLQDSAIDAEAMLRELMAERVARIGNTHLTTGDAASKPHGIMTAAGAGFTAASATAIVFDDLIELEHSVDPAYRMAPGCRWMFHDSTLKAIRKLKDGNGDYIWQPASVQTGAPAMLLNYPYSINQDVATIATGVRSVAFGDFSKYVVRVVNNFTIRRLNERYAEADQVGFVGFSRLDGNLLDAAAVKRLLHP